MRIVWMYSLVPVVVELVEQILGAKETCGNLVEPATIRLPQLQGLGEIRDIAKDRMYHTADVLSSRRSSTFVHLLQVQMLKNRYK